MLRKILTRLTLEGSRQITKRWASSNKFNPECLFGKLGVIGVPFGKGQKKKGKHEAGLRSAPDIIRRTGILRSIQCLGIDVNDYGNIEYEPECDVSEKNMVNLDHVAPCAKQVAKSVKNCLEEGRGCLVLGGDHSIATGSIYGHMQVTGNKDIAVVYVDAHADINTNTTSPSGNMHGMPLALLTMEMREQWPENGVSGMGWLCPSLPMCSVAFIGTRSVDAGEAKFLAANNATVFSMEEISSCGLHKILCKALNKIDPQGKKSIHLSFDIDALDPLEAPCTTAPVRGGLTLREAITIAEAIYKTGRLSVVDLVEVNPVIGTELQKQVTLEAVEQLLLAMYGHSRRGNVK